MYIEMVGFSVRPTVSCSCKVLAKYLVGGVDCQDRSHHSAVETSSPGKRNLYFSASTDSGCRREGRHYHRHWERVPRSPHAHDRSFQACPHADKQRGKPVALYRMYIYMYYGISHILTFYRVYTYVYYCIAPLNRYHHYLVRSSFLHLKAFNEVQTVKFKRLASQFLIIFRLQASL
jgi:hypothetical protein